MRAHEFIIEYKEYPVEEYHGVNFKMIEKYPQLIVRALDDWDNEMGHVVFNIGDNDELDPQDLEVDQRYQGQGVARVMYDYVKNHGYEIHRSWDQTPAGKGFWDKHRGEDVRIWEDELDEKVNNELFNDQTIVKQINDRMYMKARAWRESYGGILEIHTYVKDPQYSDLDRDIGYVRFRVKKRSIDGEPYLEAGMVHVNEQFRRQGIARLMYQWANELGNEILPSTAQLAPGRAMWQGMGKDIKQPAPIMEPVKQKTANWLQRMKKAFAESVDAGQVLKYVKSIHHDFHIDDTILTHPEWELTRVPLNKLHIPDPESGEDLDDPYNRVQMIDMYHVDDITRHDIERKPIVVDSDGHIIDGNHRALAARLSGMKDIPAYVPTRVNENFADGKVKGKSRPGRVKRAGASCAGSVTDLRAKAKKYGGERGKMYHWCANMKGGKKK